MPIATHRRRGYEQVAASEFEKLIEEAEADVAAGRVENFDKFIRRFKETHPSLFRAKSRLRLPLVPVIQKESF